MTAISRAFDAGISISAEGGRVTLRGPKTAGAAIFEITGQTQGAKVGTVSKGFIRIVRAAGLEKTSFRDLRRTFLTVLAGQSVNQKLCQTLAGHASMTTTGRYYQSVTDEAAHKAAAKVRAG